MTFWQGRGHSFPLRLHYGTVGASPAGLSAINRVTAEGYTYREDLKVTPYQGMLAITKNAAIILGTDDIMGTIEGGKLANFTILEQNPLAVEPINIKDIKIYASVYKGKMYMKSKIRV